MVKKFVILLLVLITSISMLTVSASAIEQSSLSLETIERVQNEVLSGNITSHKDVLLVALREQQQRDKNEENRAMLAQKMDLGIDTGESLSITQELGTKFNADGSKDSIIAVTALAVADENGKQVNRTTIGDTYTDEDENSLDEYEIYATHTVLYNRRIYNYGDLDMYFKIQVYEMTTRLTYESDTEASLLEQVFKYYGPGNIPLIDDEKKIYNPQNDKDYDWKPDERPWIKKPSPDIMVSGAIITCEGEEFELSCSISS